MARLHGRRGSGKARRSGRVAHAFFAAYVRVNQPFLGGEDLETMDKIFQEVLTAVGDTSFLRRCESAAAEFRAP